MNKFATYKFRRITRWAAGLFAAMTLATACVTIDDNIDDCFALARLKFRNTYTLSSADRFATQGQTLDLYVYNKADSTFVTSRSISREEFTSPDGVSLNWLRMGDYVFVAVGNLDRNYYDCRNYEHNLKNLRIRMLCDDGLGTITRNPSPLFFGTGEIAREDRDVKIIELIKNTNDIIINIVDTTPAEQGGGTRVLGAREMEFKIEVPLENEGRRPYGNGTIRYDNSIDEEDTRPMTHITTLDPGEKEHTHTATLTVGRLFQGDNTLFTLTETETGTVLASENLTDNIIERLRIGQLEPQFAGMEANEYLDRQDTYTFYYEMKLVHNVLVIGSIGVDDWHKINQGGQGGILW